MMMLEPEQRIEEDEIYLSDVDRAIAYDEYFNGKRPLSGGIGAVNMLDEVKLKPATTKDTQKNYWIYIASGVVLLITLIAILYWRFK